MDNNKQLTLETILTELITKLNNGNKISRDDIETNYSEIKHFIERLDVIDGFPFDISNEDIYCFKESKRKTFDKYHIEDIIKAIMEYETNDDYEKDIQDIIKESKLPRRDDEKYQIILTYEPYELTHCISYEMAIRNDEVKALLKKIIFLTIQHRNLVQADWLHHNDSALFYFLEIEEQRHKLQENLNNLDITLDIDLENSDLTQIQNKLMSLIIRYTTELEEKYYMTYDRSEIIPQGMEDIFKEPNNLEPDNKLNQHIINVIEQIQYGTNYKSNDVNKDGYSIYQGGYKDSRGYTINKIKPNFKRPMREFNQTEVAFNISLPRNEIIKYIKKIKDDYDNKNTAYKTLNQLLYGDDTKTEDKLDHSRLKDYADDFFIYDYYTQSDEEHEKRLELIQKKLSQYHGMKIELERNDYTPVNYDEVNKKKEEKITKPSSPSSAEDLIKSFKNNPHATHYLQVDIIKKRLNNMRNIISSKKYKVLILHK